MLTSELESVYQSYKFGLHTAAMCGWRPTKDYSVLDHHYLEDVFDDEVIPTSKSPAAVASCIDRAREDPDRPLCIEVAECGAFHEAECENEECPGCCRTRWDLKCVRPRQPRRPAVWSE